MSTQVISVTNIEQKIFYIRGHKVLLDFDLADLYGVEAKQLKRAVRRNAARFPADFMFMLTKGEHSSLRCQIGTSKRGGRRYLPYAFTEQGVAMLSSVLHSERAIQVNIAIMRAFVKLREILTTHKELAQRLAQLESRMDKKDQEVMALFEAIRQLMETPPEPKKLPIGFHP